jgi:hypothetical protein
MKEPLALPHAERDSITFLKMVRQEHPVPEVLVVPQIPGRPTYLTSQPLLLRGRKTAGPSCPFAFLQPCQSLGDKALNPVFHAPGRVSIETRCLIRTGALEDPQNHVEPMEVSPFLSFGDFIFDGCNKGVCIRNNNPSHWEHLLVDSALSISNQSIIRNYL